MNKPMFLRSQRDMFPSHAGAGAIISDCEQYRYVLWREWEFGSGTVVFVGLNPSIADAIVNDNTICRCRQFAMDWGFHKLVMVNLFAFRATRPEDMMRAADPVGPENDAHLLRECVSANLVVAAWGNGGFHKQRADAALAILQDLELMCFRATALGAPMHPLYQRKDTPLIPYRR